MCLFLCFFVSRSESELELEEKIKGKLKQAYKIAKIAAQKKKDKERENREAQPLDLAVNGRIVEGEEGEEDEESVEFSDDEQELVSLLVSCCFVIFLLIHYFQIRLILLIYLHSHRLIYSFVCMYFIY